MLHLVQICTRRCCVISVSSTYVLKSTPVNRQLKPASSDPILTKTLIRIHQRDVCNVCMRELELMPMSCSNSSTAQTLTVDTSATWCGSPINPRASERRGPPLSDTTRCRYESGESYPASWAQLFIQPPPPASVCGHHKVDVDLEMEKAVSNQVWI
jgi:hypothetical protein